MSIPRDFMQRVCQLRPIVMWHLFFKPNHYELVVLLQTTPNKDFVNQSINYGISYKLSPKYI